MLKNWMFLIFKKSKLKLISEIECPVELQTTLRFPDASNSLIFKLLLLNYVDFFAAHEYYFKKKILTDKPPTCASCKDQLNLWSWFMRQVMAKTVEPMISS